MRLLEHVLISIFAALLISNTASAQDRNVCITHHDLVRSVLEKTLKDKNKSAEFRINRADDGQSLIYWHTGGRTGSFFAATFKSDGCGILRDSGELRRFIFPKTAFNTGVFFEMDKFDHGLQSQALE